MTLDTTKTAGDDVSAAEWNEAATACNKVTDSTLTASNVSDFDTEVANNTDVALNTTHRSSDGTDHTYIDQDLRTTASPEHVSVKLTDGLSNPTYNEGELFYDDDKKAVSYFNNESDITVNLGQEVLLRGLKQEYMIN